MSRTRGRRGRLCFELVIGIFESGSGGGGMEGTLVRGDVVSKAITMTETSSYKTSLVTILFLWYEPI
jgi:hypothetical protein